MESGIEMTEMPRTDHDGPRVPLRRIVVLAIVGGTLLVLALAALWVRVADPFNPYRPGTMHTATIINGTPECPNTWSVTLRSGSNSYNWMGDAPRGWDPQGVAGTLHILRSWGTNGPDAVFDADGQEASLRGGRLDGKHAFAAVCGDTP